MPRKSLFPAVACTLVIAALSLWPRPPQPSEALMFPHADKVVHAIMYASYTSVLSWTFMAVRGNWLFAVAIVVYGAAFGAVMELLQAVVPVLDRTLSGLDMLANVVGSVAGVVFFLGASRFCKSDA